MPFGLVRLSCVCIVVLALSRPALSQSSLGRYTKSNTDQCLARFPAGAEGDLGAAYNGGLTSEYERLTPASAPGAMTVSALFARCLIERMPDRLTIVAASDEKVGIPGAVAAPVLGMGGSFLDSLQSRGEATLSALTASDRTRPLLFYCRNARCFKSYNAVLRAVNAGYRNIYWLRDGLKGWTDQGLSTKAVSQIDVDESWDTNLQAIVEGVTTEAKKSDANIVGSVLQAVAMPKQEHRISLSLAAGKRYVVAATCDDDCTELNLRLLDGEGNPIKSVESSGDEPEIEIIPERSGDYQLVIGMSKCERPLCAFTTLTVEVAKATSEETGSRKDSQRTPTISDEEQRKNDAQLYKVMAEASDRIEARKRGRAAATLVSEFEAALPNMANLGKVEGGTVYVDKRGRTKSGDRRTANVWLLLDALMDHDGRDVDTMSFQALVNCKRRSAGGVEATFYRNGEKAGTGYMMFLLPEFIDPIYNAVTAHLC